MKISQVLSVVSILLALLAAFVEIYCPVIYLIIPGWFALGLIAFYLFVRDSKGKFCADRMWSSMHTADIIVLVIAGLISLISVGILVLMQKLDSKRIHG